MPLLNKGKQIESKSVALKLLSVWLDLVWLLLAENSVTEQYETSSPLTPEQYVLGLSTLTPGVVCLRPLDP